MSATDAVVVTTVVAVDPETAFEVFTDEVDAWWRRGPRFRYSDSPASTMRFESGEGGRLLEIDANGAAEPHGTVLVWKPAERLVWESAPRQFGDPTRVDVRFEADGDGTRVTVEHSGFDAVPEDARARHGLGVGDAFLSMMGMWWADLLTSHRNRAEKRSTR